MFMSVRDMSSKIEQIKPWQYDHRKSFMVDESSDLNVAFRVQP